MNRVLTIEYEEFEDLEKGANRTYDYESGHEHDDC